MFGVDVSRELLSKITDSVMEGARESQARPLDAVYPVIFLDALVCKVRENGSLCDKAAHLAVGVNIVGRKEALRIWIETTEQAGSSWGRSGRRSASTGEHVPACLPACRPGDGGSSVE